MSVSSDVPFLKLIPEGPQEGTQEGTRDNNSNYHQADDDSDTN
jgi:hypothetical protein